jgi:metalloendopeptidase OMA1, mitochondrial
VCRDEDGLAAVISHEIAHSVAHHSAERMSQSFLAIAGLLLVSIASGTDVSFLGSIMDLVYLRPGSRKQEVHLLEPHVSLLFT